MGSGLWLPLFLIWIAIHAGGEGKAKDPSGLVVDRGLAMVKANCTSCHSAKLIVQNRADARGWRTIIASMQKEQGLWQLEETVQQEIIDYLARNYKPERRGRRKPLALPLENPR